MATYYWRGGAGTWNNTNTTNWSTSSGGASGAGPPTSADDVIFDNNSDSGAGFTVTGSATAVCRDFTIGSGGSLPDVIITFSGACQIYGNFTAQNSANNVFSSCDPTFASTTTGKTITSAGRSFRAPTFNGAGGDWTLQDALDFSGASNLTHTAGTIKTGGFNVTGGGFVTSGSGTKGFEAGASTITLSKTASPQWDATAGSNFTFTRGTSTIVLSTSTSAFAANGTYYNLTFSSSSEGGSATVTGANTFNNVTFTAPSSDGVRKAIFAGNTTIEGTLTTGSTTIVRRQIVESSVFGTSRTLTCAAIAATSDTDFADITIAGAASPLSGTRLGDAGGNSGITFGAGANKYWNLTGTVNITATGWALTDGGSPGANNFPLPQDNLYFTNTGAMGTVSITAGYYFNNLDLGGRTTSATFNITNATPVFKSVTFGTGITAAGTGAKFTMRARNGETSVLRSNGISIAQVANFEATGTGKIQLYDNATFTDTSNMQHLSGTLDLNDKTLSFASQFRTNSSYLGTKEIQFGTNGKLLANTRYSGSDIPLNYNFTNATWTGSKKVEFTPASPTTSIGPTMSNQSTVSQMPNFYFSSGSISTSFSGSVDDLNTQGYTGTSSIFAGRSIYGNVVIGSGHTPDPSSSSCILWAPVGTTKTFTSNGRTLNCQFAMNGQGTIQLADALTLGAPGTAFRQITLNEGTIDTNGFSVACSAVDVTGSTTRVLTLGSSTVTCSGASTAWTVSGTNNTINASSSTIVLTCSGSAITFTGGSKTYGTLTFAGTGNGTSYDFTIAGSNSFSTWNKTRSGLATIIDFATSLSTTTIRTSFPMSGTSGLLTKLFRNAGSSTFTITYSGAGTVSVDYMNISRSNATPNTLTWYAGANSTDGGNNTGWIFTAPPVASSGNFLMFFIR